MEAYKLNYADFYLSVTGNYWDSNSADLKDIATSYDGDSRTVEMIK